MRRLIVGAVLGAAAALFGRWLWETGADGDTRAETAGRGGGFS